MHANKSVFVENDEQRFPFFAFVRHVAAAFSLAALALAATCASAQNINLNVPAGHPRLWYGNAQRLTQARAYAATHAIQIPGYPHSAQARNRALTSLMSNTSPSSDPDCAAAVHWLQVYDLEAPAEDDTPDADHADPCDMNAQSVSCDRARWGGEDAILVYDWCHAYIDTLAPSAKQGIITKWNHYISVMNTNPSGWQTQQGNNYYAGYMRNSLLWGIATYGENPGNDQAFINAALKTRFQNNYVPWTMTYGVGGVAAEGPQYGAYQLGYSVIALQTALDMGYDAYAKTPYYADATYYLEYSTLPTPTYNGSSHTQRYELFPFSDIGEANANTAYNSDYANLLGANAMRVPSMPRARHAKAWLARTGTQADWWVRAALSTLATGADDSDLPDDYYAAGSGFLYTRSAAVAASTSLLMQTDSIGREEYGGATHDSPVAGSFHLWRKGNWVSRATFGYRGSDDANFTGFHGQGSVSTDSGVANNQVLFGGLKGSTYQMKGPVLAKAGRTHMLRLESASAYTYAAVDLKPAYRSAPPGNACWLAADDWPFADVAIREYLYLRNWDALLVFDRLRSGDDSQHSPYTDSCGSSGYKGPQLDANAVVKSFVLHFPGPPSIAGHRVTAANPGNYPNAQALDAHVLLPIGAAPRLIDEKSCCSGSAVAQYRMEVDQSGSAESYDLVVVQARDLAAAPLSAQLTQNGADLLVTLTGQGETAVVRLKTGMTSTGGSVQFDAAAPHALYAGVQQMTISDSGPRWEILDDGIFANDFESP